MTIIIMIMVNFMITLAIKDINDDIENERTVMMKTMMMMMMMVMMVLVIVAIVTLITTMALI